MYLGIPQEREEDLDGEKTIMHWVLDKNKKPNLARGRSYLTYYVKEMLFISMLKKTLKTHNIDMNKKLKYIKTFETEIKKLFNQDNEFEAWRTMETDDEIIKNN